MRVLALIVFLIVYLSQPHEANAATQPSLKCDIGPVTKTYGKTLWLVYSCDDYRTIVIATAPENPAMPFYFTIRFNAGKLELYGKGTGSKELTDAAFSELSILSEQDIRVLITQTRGQGSNGGESGSSPRVVNVTSRDSAAGWSPTEEQELQVLIATKHYFAALDAKQLAQAYAMMTDLMKQKLTKEMFIKQQLDFDAQAGILNKRQLLKVTWTKDSAHSPLPGVYAAVDIATHYANIDRVCGFIVLYQKPSGGAFEVMREEKKFITNSQAQEIVYKQSQDALDKMWAEVAPYCPN